MTQHDDTQTSGPSALIRRRWQALLSLGPNEFQLWLIALIIGTLSGLAAVAFRYGIDWLQSTAYGTEDLAHLHSYAEQLDWWAILLLPAAGGLAVGLLLDRFTADGRVRSVADVIESAALHEGRLNTKRALVSTLASLITLSTGGSTGREGPVVHLAAQISSYVSRLIRADGITGRDLLGCAVAAGVSASFNAPLAGALFALEVVLRHFAVHAFAPIAIASVSGTVVSRLFFGDVTEFRLPGHSTLEFYQELPAFLLLGLLCGAVAYIFMSAIFWVEERANALQGRTGLPRALRPAIAGLLLGTIAIFYPHIIGVGYETTSLALTGQMLARDAMIFAIIKVAAVAITVGGNMGGGVFSPSLMVGALTGLAFGLVATAIVPEYSGEGLLYALAGMGAVAASVLGAPISTTLIVFELTGDWQTGLAVMVTVSVASALSSRMVDRSFFLTQLERKGVHLAAGPQAYLLATVRVETVMRSAQHPRAAPEEECWKMVGDGRYLDASATLEQAMPLFERTNAAFIPVVHLAGGDAPPALWGALFQIDALRAYNRALAATAAEEHS